MKKCRSKKKHLQHSWAWCFRRHSERQKEVGILRGTSYDVCSHSTRRTRPRSLVCETWPRQETLTTSTETKFETFESERCMVEKSNSSDRVAEEKFHSWEHHGLGTRTFAIPKSHKFQQPKAAVDKEWNQLQNVRASRKVRNQNEVIARAKASTTVHFAAFMDKALRACRALSKIHQQSCSSRRQCETRRKRVCRVHWTKCISTWYDRTKFWRRYQVHKEWPEKKAMLSPQKRKSKDEGCRQFLEASWSRSVWHFVSGFVHINNHKTLGKHSRFSGPCSSSVGTHPCRGASSCQRRWGRSWAFKKEKQRGK